MNVWVDLVDLKADLGVSDDRDDVALSTMLAAARAFTERVRPGFAYRGESDLPAPTDDLVLGTVRLAGRWHTRRRSPDGLVSMAEFGAARVPSFDPDIERLLGIGRYAPAGFA